MSKKTERDKDWKNGPLENTPPVEAPTGTVVHP
jgi:hypothetical protein